MHALAAQTWVERPHPHLTFPEMAFHAGRGRVVLNGYHHTLEWDGRRWTASAPGAYQWYGAMAYDPVADCLVLTGLSYFPFGYYVSTWDERVWRRQPMPSQSGPAYGDHQTLNYLGALGALVLHGGSLGGSPLAQTWLCKPPYWQQIRTLPPARQGHATSSCWGGSGLVLFGGEDGVGQYFDTYQLSTWPWPPATWMPVNTPAHPSARAFHAMAETDQGVLLFGGRDSSGAYSDETWLLDFTNGWQQLHPPVSPPARAEHGMVWDSVRHRLVLAGGSDAHGRRYDTWEWNGTTWRLCNVAPPLERMPVVYDSRRGCGVAYREGQTREWNGLAWQVRPAPRTPTSVAGHALAYDAARGVTVLFGGQASPDYRDTSHVLAETWEWNGFAWALRILPRGPLARTGAAMAYDAARSTTVLLGGESSAGPMRDTWLYDGSVWRSAAPGPSARTVAAACYDPRRQVVVLFGGLDRNGALADTWEWDGTVWRRAAPRTVPPARGGHALAFDAQQGVVVMAGGWGPDEHRDVWQWDGVDWSQSRVRAKRTPCPYNLMWDERMQQLVASGSSHLSWGADYVWGNVFVLSHTPASSEVKARGCGAYPLQIAAFGVPSLGNDCFAVDIKGAPPRTPIALLVAARPANLRLPTGCALLVDPTSIALTATALTSGLGRATFPLPVPAMPTWRGVELHAQAVALETGPPASVDVSGLLQMRLGD
ncbi:MAG: kelch repeat-containing protein [Planctomycetota bacterium]